MYVFSEASTATVIKGWSWRQAGQAEWTQCAHDKPTTEIFPDLLDAKRIPDPFVDRNEKDVQWVGEKDWEYQASFAYVAVDGHNHVDLVFEGLDTFATVYLNDEKILESDNMFHEHRVAVDKSRLLPENKLRIRFDSAWNHAKALEKAHGKVLEGSNGDHSRMYVRKAQYHWGWDWGPTLMTCGPYKEIRLESYSVRLEDVHVSSVVKDTTATASVAFAVVGHATAELDAEIVLVSASGKKETVTVPVQHSAITKATIELPNAELWFPAGYGPQSLYSVTLSLKLGGKVLDSLSRKVALRKMELVQEPLVDQPGTSFFFRVNGTPIFCAGSNWIPAHSFVTKLTREDYRKWLHKAVDGNQVMIRVWGGGLYEPDVFYELCDELGLLVWQDFMFACGAYPYYSDIAASIRREAEHQVKRLRNFGSVALFAGNNEDYMIAETKGLEYNKADTSGDYTATTFPARTAYERDLPEIVGRLSDIPYHPGSPWGGVNIEDKTVGDIHQWNVWHGQQEKYQNWRKLAGRFVSEFGMLAFPEMSTIEQAVTDPEQRYPQSVVMDHHNKATGFERRLALYVMENLKVDGMDLASWIYATQLMQSECLAYAYRCWRREWKGPGREYVAGALVWQINDCWPVTSWAICDFYGNNKLAYYAVKRESAPLGVGIYRCMPEEKAGTYDPNPEGAHDDLLFKTYVFDVWGVNLELVDRTFTLKLAAYNVKAGHLVKQYPDQTVHLAANRSTEVLADLPVDQDTALQARLVDEHGNVVARQGDWPQPLKYLTFNKRNVQIERAKASVTITTTGPIKGVELYTDDKSATFGDNGFDVFPGDPYTVAVEGNVAAVKVRWYQM